MSLMRPVLTWFTISALLASFAFAQDSTTARASEKAESFETLKEEYEEALRARSARMRAAYEQAKRERKEKELKLDSPLPFAVFSPRFLAIAERDPEGAKATDALKLTLVTSAGPKQGIPLETRAKAIKILRDYYVMKPSIAGFLKIVVRYSDDSSKALVAEVIARNPDRRVQLAAYREQVAFREGSVRLAESLKDPKWRKLFGMGISKEFEQDQIVKAAKAKVEIENIKKILRESYSDLYDDVSVGQLAPELKLSTIDGKAGRLSALKGKVVVLDIWATWCGPCKAMIPHEREMVERLKGKPFELVGISIDSELKDLKEFLAKEKLPWTHWWAGTGGWESSIAVDWDIRSIPTIFVLDTSGAIRYKNIRGEELEKAVNALLAEKANTVSARGRLESGESR